MRTLTLMLFLAACGTPTEAPTGASEATATTEATPTADASADWKHYGSEFTVADTLDAATLLANPAAYVDQTVKVEGRVADVCQKMGCWMVVTDDAGNSMRVLMKDHAYSVDKAATGYDCQIEGVVVAKTIDPEEVAHFESESGKDAPIPEKAVTGTTTYELVAAGVSMKSHGT